MGVDGKKSKEVDLLKGGGDLDSGSDELVQITDGRIGMA